ncbi:DUF6364 family protein [Methyloprofundus sp.]|uniref:DUF6364 family protein n=1 Tax=Methyloprofundus sp. TaxID=2020875 RepID=UPI003D11623D
MTNLTITIDEQVLKKARMRALEDGVSINALLREYLEKYTGANKQYQQVTQEILKIAKGSTATSGGKRWSRDELYER